jgi:hypothetical protein
MMLQIKDTVVTYALRLLGFPHLDLAGKPFALEYKMTAVLTYLAVEGETPKYKLAMF